MQSLNLTNSAFFLTKITYSAILLNETNTKGQADYERKRMGMRCA